MCDSDCFWRRARRPRPASRRHRRGQGRAAARRRGDRRWEDARAEVMAAGEHAEVACHVEAWRRDEGAQPGQELVGAHVGVDGTAAPRGFEVDAHAAVWESLGGVVGERRARQVAADPFEPLTVAPVDDRRCMQMHAQHRHGERWRGRGLCRRDQARAGERELHAGAQSRVLEGAVRGEGVPSSSALPWTPAGAQDLWVSRGTSLPATRCAEVRARAWSQGLTRREQRTARSRTRDRARAREARGARDLSFPTCPGVQPM